MSWKPFEYHYMVLILTRKVFFYIFSYELFRIHLWHILVTRAVKKAYSNTQTLIELSKCTSKETLSSVKRNSNKIYIGKSFQWLFILFGSWFPSNCKIY